MRRIDWRDLDDRERARALARPPRVRSAELRVAVADILDEVRARGDAALRRYAAKFDQVEIGDIEVTAGEFDAADASLDPGLKRAVREAAERIEAFHRACMVPDVALDTAPGVRVERVSRAIARVGLYVPAGSAPLPSTVLMLAIPARLAGCEDIVLCSPPRADGGCDPAVLFAARLCGVQRVFKSGGAQAIAALAYGTESVPHCDKLFGPGNAFVTEAKLQVSSDPAGAAIDMPAGPSEVLVIADDSANPAFVAADLLSQAEHGPDSQVLLVSDSDATLDAAAREVERQCATLPRAAIARQALAHSRLVRVALIADAFEVGNRYAPEHLIVQVREPRRWLDAIRNAGSVFLGPWTPESLGDYCSGSNHVLPTYGWARSVGGLSVASFQKQVTLQECTAEGLRTIGPCAATLAAAERLDAHRRAIEVRLASGPSAASAEVAVA
ncbi:MAG: histidinol dehydrogenase [Xanthomonadales bacterium]|nr:histidinol dehydrogenase [Xanthomonadales bacterium]ODU93581.1 MAG: histidinol dehydrogenase [Rhodanobacter sp. SCN 66-43]OJY86678.1 MAG: histidinol dehydrogenase [Xanthomonadales bacterium 66-474]